MSQLRAQLVDARVGLSASLRPLERKRCRDDADGQRAELARDLRDDGRSAGPRPTALAGGDEHHVRAAQRVLDLVVRLGGRRAPDVRVRAGAETLRQLASDVDLHLGVRHLQLLQVGVDGDELDLVDARVDHAVDRVQAGTADTDDADDRQVGA